MKIIPFKNANLFFTLLAILCLTPTSQAQTFQWAQAFGGAQYDMGKSVTVDADGNIITTGYFEGTVDFDPGAGVFNLTSAGDQDIFIQKMNASGNFIWAKSVGSSGGDRGLSVTTDLAGNILATGHFEGTVDFDPGPATHNKTSEGIIDVFILKLNSAGNLVWVQTFGGMFWDEGTSVKTDAAGNVFTIGTFSEIVDFNPDVDTFNITSQGNEDIFIQKLNANGYFQWVKAFGDVSNDYGFSLALDQTGNIITTGSFGGTVDFDPDMNSTFYLTSVAFYDVYVQKLDPSGNFLWAKAFGGALSDIGASVTVDNAGNVISTGGFIDSVDFDPGPGVFNLIATGATDIYVQKLDAAGNFLWAKGFGDSGHDEGKSLKSDANNNILITGIFNGTIDFDPGPGISNFTANGDQDVFISKLDSSGEFVWTRTFGGAGYDFGEALTLDNIGNLYICGNYFGTVDFDPDAGIANYTSNGSHDIFVQKLTQCFAGQAVNTTPAGNLLICDGDYTVLTAAGYSNLIWYDMATGGSIIGTGTTFTTPVLGNTTTYYVYDISQCNTSRTAITVNVLPVSTSSTSASICANQTPLLWNGYSLDSSGIYTASYTAANGCDSIATLTLNVSPCIVCVPNFTINYSPFYNSLTESQSWIVSSGTVEVLAGTKVKLDAHQSSFVQLNPGFKAEYGAIFVAQAFNGCTAGEPQLPNAKNFHAIDQPGIVNPVIYPNPAQTTIHVVHDLSAENIRIFDMVGKLVIEKKCEHENNTMIDINHLTDGVYYLIISGYPAQKFVKN